MALSFIFNADGSRYTRGLEKMRGQTKAWATGIKGMIGGAFAIGAVIAGFSKLMTKMDRIHKLSRRYQTDAASIQRLGFAAEQNGASFEIMAKAMAQGNRSAQEAANGLKTYQRAFDALNIDVQRFKDLDQESQMHAIADAVKNATDQNLAMASAQQILGRSALELMPLLLQGGDAMKRLGNEIDVASDASVAAIADANDQMNKFKNNILVAVIPAVTALMNIWKGGKIFFNPGTDFLKPQFAERVANQKKAQAGGVDELERSGVVFAPKFRKILTDIDDSDEGRRKVAAILKLHGFTMLEFYQAQAKAQRRVSDEMEKQKKLAIERGDKVRAEEAGLKANEKAIKDRLATEEKITAEIEKRANLDRSTKQKVRAAQGDVDKADKAVEKAIVDVIGDESPVNQKKLSDAELEQQEALTKLKILQKKLATEESAIRKKILDDGVAEARARLEEETQSITTNTPQSSVVSSSLASIAGGGNVASFTSDPVLAAAIESNKILHKIEKNTERTPAAPTIPEI